MDNEEFFLLIKELETPGHRNNAIYDLIRLQDNRVEPYLIKIALDNSMPISDRFTAMGGLWDASSKEAVLAVRKILETSKSFDLIIRAFETLGLLRDTESGANIIKYLASSNSEGVRYMAAQSLGRMAYVPATPYLHNMIREDSPVIRQYACGALINIIQTLDQNSREYRSILSDLKDLLNDSSIIIREQVQAFLTYLENNEK